MGLTNQCDIFAALSESAINDVVLNIARQRPSLFNYGTEDFVTSPALMCQAISVASGLPANQPRVTLEPPLPVPGTSGGWGLQYCAQLTKMQVDFHPGSLFQLPPELSPLAAQALAIRLEACGAIACPSRDQLAQIAEKEAAQYAPLSPTAWLRGEGKGQQLTPRVPKALPIQRDHLHCFCLDLFATARIERRNEPSGPVLAPVLTGLEIVDIKPEGLEDSIECLLTATVSLAVLPRIRIALDEIVLSLASYGDLHIGLTPISLVLPFNPSIANDQLQVFVDVSMV